MKYIFAENIDNEFKHKSGKARLDSLEIAQKLGYKTVDVKTVYGIRQKKYQKPEQFYLYLKNARIWDKAFASLKTGDIVIVQINPMNTTLFFGNVIKKYRKKLNIILLIHDIDSLRFLSDETKSKAFMCRANADDKILLTSATVVISHNATMTKTLINMGVEKNRIVNLEIFDYLDNESKFAKPKYNGDIVIAGNLSLYKAAYLKDLKKVKNLNFNLYGPRYDHSCDAKNINYKGSFLPDELQKKLEGSFGLVWDGEKIDDCTGYTGNYLKINNPYKLSLYLSSGLPVIVWDKSAEKDFVEKNGVGFSVGSIEEIPKKMKKISEKDYEEMVKNAKNLAKKLKSGFFLAKAIKETEQSCEIK